MQVRARSRQETVNKRFKNWGILKQVYRNTITSHGDAFRAIAMTTQQSIRNGEALVACDNRDPPYKNDAKGDNNDGGDSENDSENSENGDDV